MSAPLKVYQKDPQAVLNFTIDWSAWLGADTIATSNFVAGSGITKDSQSNNTTSATVKLSGGTDGSDYDVVNTITTAGGLTDERTIRIQVRQQ
jgi:hypothetical protein